MCPVLALDAHEVVGAGGVRVRSLQVQMLNGLEDSSFSIVWVSIFILYGNVRLKIEYILQKIQKVTANSIQDF